MNLIVAVDNNWAIGSKNELLIRIPNDHKHFREETTGKVVVLGRKTLETFPQGMPLKNRINIILSKDPNYQVKDAIVVHSIEELLEELKKYDEENIYIIGGESIYRQMLLLISTYKAFLWCLKKRCLDPIYLRTLYQVSKNKNIRMT